jgi:hypothetical protein
MLTKFCNSRSLLHESCNSWLRIEEILNLYVWRISNLTPIVLLNCNYLAVFLWYTKNGEIVSNGIADRLQVLKDVTYLMFLNFGYQLKSVNESRRAHERTNYRESGQTSCRFALSLSDRRPLTPTRDRLIVVGFFLASAECCTAAWLFLALLTMPMGCYSLATARIVASRAQFSRACWAARVSCQLWQALWTAHPFVHGPIPTATRQPLPTTSRSDRSHVCHCNSTRNARS